MELNDKVVVAARPETDRVLEGKIEGSVEGELSE